MLMLINWCVLSNILQFKHLFILSLHLIIFNNTLFEKMVIWCSAKCYKFIRLFWFLFLFRFNFWKFSMNSKYQKRRRAELRGKNFFLNIWIVFRRVKNKVKNIYFFIHIAKKINKKICHLLQIAFKVPLLQRCHNSLCSQNSYK